MPKLVDHDRRRAELARVVWEVIDRHGIEGATVRRVAERAGVSIGGLRHYFDSQPSLLRFAAEQVAVGVGARLEVHLERGCAGVDGARRMLEELLPLDATRRVEAEVWMACMARFRLDRTWDDLRRASWAGERHVCRLATALCRGEPSPSVVGEPLVDEWSERIAARLHVVVDGLTVQAATHGAAMPSTQVRALLRDELELLVRPRVDRSAG